MRLDFKPAEREAPTRKTSQIVIPSVTLLNKLTSSDDAHILLQLEGVHIRDEDITNTKDFEDWREFQKALKLTGREIAAVQDRVQQWHVSTRPVEEGWIRDAPPSSDPGTPPAPADTQNEELPEAKNARYNALRRIKVRRTS